MQDTVRTHPAQQFNGQIGEEKGQTGHIIASVDDDQDRQVTGLPLSSVQQPLDDLPGLADGRQQCRHPTDAAGPRPAQPSMKSGRAPGRR